MNVDIMQTDIGWYHCANWCGREVNARGNFCGHCAWHDCFAVALGKDLYGQWDDYHMPQLTFEMQNFRGSKIVYRDEDFPLDR